MAVALYCSSLLDHPSQTVLTLTLGMHVDIDTVQISVCGSGAFIVRTSDSVMLFLCEARAWKEAQVV